MSSGLRAMSLRWTQYDFHFEDDGSTSADCTLLQYFLFMNRPLLESEMQYDKPVEVHAEVNKIIVRDIGSNKNAVKAFSFDKVFGPEAGQALVYNNVAAPLIQEVIMGFNCTILAYGQTGTGKTFTIEGDRNAALNNYQEHSKAGIIPRSMKHIFEELTNQKCDFEVSVSYLELYNEEIFDLLSKAEDLTKLKLYDSYRGSVTVQGLEIRKVKSMKDVYDVLDKGCKKRRKAATFLNKMSSRSHTVFTVIVKMREHSTTIEKTKTGKLNLVDLAGSENIGRSGAVKKLAREAGNINQSLLALGRVITALCENAIHIPYRESKLTRLLRDSLGGQTKTTVIATISPSVLHLDETLNTLEYALRAKNIMNKPEVNAQVSATALTKDYIGKICFLEGQIKELSSKVEFQVDPDNLTYLETAIATKTSEIREESEIKAKLLVECQEVDEAILKAMETLRLKELEWEKCISDQDELAAKLAQDREEILSEEREILILEPVMANLHEKLHKVMKENEEITNEVKKMEEKASEAMNENSRLQKQLSSLCKAQKQFNETLLQFKHQLVMSINEVQKTIISQKAECEEHLSTLDSGFDSFLESSEKMCLYFKNLANDVEKLKTNAHVALTNALREEETQARGRLTDIESSNISSLISCDFDALYPLLTQCEENIDNLYLSFTQWRETFMQKLTSQDNLLNNYLSAEDKNLWQLRESCKNVTQKQKEFIQEYSEVISAALSEKSENQKKFDEKMIAIEEAVEQMQKHLTEKLDNDVDKSILAHDKFREHADGEMRKAESLIAFCQSSVSSLEPLKGEYFTSSPTLCDKMKDTRESANNAVKKYNDLLPGFKSCVNQTKFADDFMKKLEQLVTDDKTRRTDMPSITSIIQNFKESLTETDQRGTTSFNEHETELKTIETSQARAVKEVHDSFNELQVTFAQGVSRNISSFETSDESGFSWKESIIKDNYEEDDDDQNTTLLSAEDSSVHDRTSVLDVTFTLPGENAINEDETGCIFCKNKDETMTAPSVSLPLAKTSKSPVFKSFKKGRNKKEVTYSEMVEKWCQELFADDADDISSECDKSDSLV